MSAEDHSSARLAASSQRLKRSNEALTRSRRLLDGPLATRLINRSVNGDDRPPVGQMVQDQFWAAVAAFRRDPALGDAGMGARAARAAAAVLGGQAATVTVAAGSSLRACWGISGQAGGLGEQLDFTAGEGPCMAAHVDGGLIVATETWITRSWPGFAALLTAHTSFRSAVAVPLAELGPAAVLTMYFNDPRGCWTVDPHAAAMVAGQIAVEIGKHIPAGPGDETGWCGLDAQSWPWPVDDRRLAVPVATGMIMAARTVDADEAMALLRAHAFATAGTIDDVAADLVEGRVDARTWRAQASGRFYD